MNNNNDNDDNSHINMINNRLLGGVKDWLLDVYQEINNNNNSMDKYILEMMYVLPMAIKCFKCNKIGYGYDGTSSYESGSLHVTSSQVLCAFYDENDEDCSRYVYCRFCCQFCDICHNLKRLHSEGCQECRNSANGNFNYFGDDSSDDNSDENNEKKCKEENCVICNEAIDEDFILNDDEIDEEEDEDDENEYLIDDVEMNDLIEESKLPIKELYEKYYEDLDYDKLNDLILNDDYIEDDNEHKDYEEDWYELLQNSDKQYPQINAQPKPIESTDIKQTLLKYAEKRGVYFIPQELRDILCSSEPKWYLSHKSLMNTLKVYMNSKEEKVDDNNNINEMKTKGRKSRFPIGNRSSNLVLDDKLSEIFGKSELSYFACRDVLNQVSAKTSIDDLLKCKNDLILSQLYGKLKEICIRLMSEEMNSREKAILYVDSFFQFCDNVHTCFKCNRLYLGVPFAGSRAASTELDGYDVDGDEDVRIYHTCKDCVIWCTYCHCASTGLIGDRCYSCHHHYHDQCNNSPDCPLCQNT